MYATESISIIQWNGITNISKLIQWKFIWFLIQYDIFLACETINVPCLTNGEEVLDKYSFSETNFNRDLIVMICMLFGFYLLGYCCLWWKIKRKN